MQSSQTLLYCVETNRSLVSSSLLLTMMESGMAEANDRELKLQDGMVSAEVIPLIIDYMCKVPISISEHLHMPLIIACDYLLLEELKEDCLHR